MVAPAPAAAPASAAANEDSDLIEIKSPMVGTYYERPNPESPPFLKVGQEISPDTTVCIIEAMKVFNEIAAEVSGTVVSVLVQNEEPVEFGKPLFKIRPRS
jgi:acetyl-CoA carboxylase biotin carboxyl carrier protein